MGLNAVVSTFVSGDGVWVVFEELQPMVRGGEVQRPFKNLWQFQPSPPTVNGSSERTGGVCFEHKLRA